MLIRLAPVVFALILPGCVVASDKEPRATTEATREPTEGTRAPTQGTRSPTEESAASPEGTTEGTLVLAWTINGTKEPPLCDSSNARALHVTVDGGEGPQDFAQRCGAFGAAIDLPPGRYTGAAVLRDANGTSRTTEAHLGAFYIYGNDILTIPIDFPASSFY